MKSIKIMNIPATTTTTTNQKRKQRQKRGSDFRLKNRSREKWIKNFRKIKEDKRGEESQVNFQKKNSRKILLTKLNEPQLKALEDCKGLEKDFRSKIQEFTKFLFCFPSTRTLFYQVYWKLLSVFFSVSLKIFQLYVTVQTIVFFTRQTFENHLKILDSFTY